MRLSNRLHEVCMLIPMMMLMLMLMLMLMMVQMLMLMLMFLDDVHGRLRSKKNMCCGMEAVPKGSSC